MNRKHIQLTAILSVLLLGLTSCGSSTTPSQTTEGTESTAVIASAEETEVPGEDGSDTADAGNDAASEAAAHSDGETAADSAETSSAEEITKAHTVTLQIDGYGEEHLPRLDGSLANEPLLMRMMEDLVGCDAETAEVYLADSFENGGTSTSWGKLIWNEMDLIISYEPPQEVKDSYVEEFEELEIDPLGRDGLVFIVNANNPVESLTLDQIRGIYTGAITDWSEVGGDAGEIRPFQRNSTSGSQTLFNKLVMQGEEAMEPDEELFVGTMGGLIEAVASFDGSGSAIGFSVYYYADKMKSDPNLKMIAVEGVEPSNDTIADGSYPLVNDFYMAIRGAEEDESPTRALRDWMLSDDGRTLLEEEGYVWARSDLEAVSRGAGNPFR